MRKPKHWGVGRGWWGGEWVGRGHLAFPLEAGVVNPHIWGSQTENCHFKQSRLHPGAGPILMAHADFRIYELSEGSLWLPEGKATLSQSYSEKWQITPSVFSRVWWGQCYGTNLQIDHLALTSPMTTGSPLVTCQGTWDHLASSSQWPSLHLNTHGALPPFFKSLLN